MKLIINEQDPDTLSLLHELIKDSTIEIFSGGFKDFIALPGVDALIVNHFEAHEIYYVKPKDWPMIMNLMTDEGDKPVNLYDAPIEPFSPHFTLSSLHPPYLIIMPSFPASIRKNPQHPDGFSIEEDNLPLTRSDYFHILVQRVIASINEFNKKSPRKIETVGLYLKDIIDMRIGLHEFSSLILFMIEAISRAPDQN